MFRWNSFYLYNDLLVDVQADPLNRGTNMKKPFMKQFCLSNMEKEVEAEAPPRVLIVDDESVLRTAIKKALKNSGYDLYLAADGREGLKIFQEVEPILIFLDLRMPDMDGFAFLKALQHKIDAPYTVVVMTGHGGDEEIKRCYKLGIHSFLRKPINLVEVCSLTERCIEFKKLEREREKLIHDLQTAAATIKTLEGFLPICASCKKIRDDQGQWNDVDTYIRERTNVEFSHGICPICVEKLYPDYQLFKSRRK
ncbi:MAG: hypothetical protein A2521_03090 [Deltaproteobacteria bacterium RIFOXYD12_FULL_57_12]|nr:MAG: hypothetical protein A2521_03090 [Deltaproteobacteria bacterium RIFOXYD12_FULL_57_12]